MVARVIRVEGNSNANLEQAARNVNGSVIPRLRGQKCFVSAHWLGDPAAPRD